MYISSTHVIKDKSIIKGLSIIFETLAVFSQLFHLIGRGQTSHQFLRSGSWQESGNYRPLSQNSDVGKTLERLVKTIIACHLDINNPIKETQHGFTIKAVPQISLILFNKAIGIYDGNEAVISYQSWLPKTVSYEAP